MAPEASLRPVSELLVTIEFEIVSTPVRELPLGCSTYTPKLLFDASQRSRLRSDPPSRSKPVVLPDETLSRTVTLQKSPNTATPSSKLFSNRQCSTDAFRSPALALNTSP